MNVKKLRAALSTCCPGFALMLCSGAISAAVTLTTIEKLPPADVQSSDLFGTSVVLDGDTALLGAWVDDDNGSAYVFTRGEAGLWIEQAKLHPLDASEDHRFGFAVALSGETALGGAHRLSGGGTGDAYVFALDETGRWVQQAKLRPNDDYDGNAFGWSVALDGDTALVGALSDDDYAMDSGSVYVFTRDGTGLRIEQAKLKPSDDDSWKAFGWSVAIDGDTALVGALSDDDYGVDSGSAYVFTRDETGNWSERAKLTASDGAAYDQFGRAVALDGDTAMVGAWGQSDSDPGAVYVFTRSSTGHWTEQAKLTAADGVYEDCFGGTSVAVDGNIALVGAQGDDGNVGSVYVYVCEEDEWSEYVKLVPSSATNFFGSSVALDGDAALIGASGATAGGAAYFFTYDASSGEWIEQAKLTAIDAANFGGAVALAGETELVGTPRAIYDTDAPGAAYVSEILETPDSDGDGYIDTEDNCPDVPNPDRVDLDGDGFGDACDSDRDGDGVDNEADNCPTDANPGQANNDLDDLGDICDPDDDNDTVLDGTDNCPIDANPGQANNDLDDSGDICDSDDDNDTVLDGTDNCPFAANADQANYDGGGQGDVCDPDDDNDTVLDRTDNCPFAANADQANYDGDEQGDICDSDDDNDTVLDETDNCPFAANADQANYDGGGQGDVCDPDDDNDTVLDGTDNCPFAANADQANYDGDERGDICDSDDDNDGVLDTNDPFPMSDTSPTVAINGCDSGVVNQILEGASFNDPIGRCAAKASNLRRSVKCVTGLATDWLQAGLIAGEEFARLVNAASCVGRRP